MATKTADCSRILLMRSTSLAVDIEFNDIWDTLAIGVMGYMDVRKRDYGFFVNPLFARLEPDDSGDLFDTDITTDMAVVSGGGFFRAATFSLG